MNPDSALAIDRKREAQPLRSKVDGSVPLTDIDRRCCERMLSLIATTCESPKRL
jgi:hypothetical protein